MNLWIYGDSFSVENNPDSGVEKTWTETVATILGLEISNNAEHGISNDYLYKSILNDIESWETGDCVIIQLTAPWRVWFFEHLPHLSNFTNCTLDSNLEEAQINAVDEYTKYLFNKEALMTQYYIIQSALKNLCLQCSDIKILVLPGFHPVEDIPGTLSTICMNEFENETVSTNFYKYWNIDPRINHLVEDNHLLLAERVCEFFIDGQLPDLVNGYATSVITSKNYKDNG